MCGKTPKAPPPVVQRDPVAEQREAEALAQTKANQETAQRRRRRQRSSLLTTGSAGSTVEAPSLLAKATPVGS